LAQESKYSVRDAGFTDVETRPYRLMLLAKDPKAPAVKKQEKGLNEQLADSNIVLVHFPKDRKGLPAELKAVKTSGLPTTPKFWLIAPDDRTLPFEPSKALGDLVYSKSRQALQNAANESLCVVLLIESTDKKANESARARIDSALAAVNKNRARLGKAPNADIKLISLPVSQREQERWTLWGLGENVSDADVPKVAVIFGKLRLAGPLLQGHWDETELMRRIAALAQPCESSDDRKLLADSALPYRWTKLRDPASDDILTEVRMILQKPGLSKDEQENRRESFEAMVAGLRDLDDDFPRDQAPAFPAHAVRRRAPAEPSMFASMGFGVALLGVGIAGWVALGLGARILDRRQTSTGNV
jgi:hypothetical protein